MFEETCLRVRVKRLVGVYSDPNQLVMYVDGNKVQIVAQEIAQQDTRLDGMFIAGAVDSDSKIE